jgi:long-chain fatty acid transport protein
MISPKKLLLVTLPVTAAFLLPVQSHATNGYFSHGTSVAEKGLAGAGVAYSQDTLSAANNPAGMVWQGGAWDIGAALFAPIRSYTVTGAPAGQPEFGLVPGTYDSDNELFLIPQFGYNWALNDKSTIGISVYGNGGMNTEYPSDKYPAGPPPPGTYYNGKAGVNFEQLFISTTYSRKFSDSASWGISGIVAYQRFKATGVGSFAGYSNDPANLSDNGTDTATGFGVRLGVQAEVVKGLTLGAAYQPEIDMGEFDDYAGLFAEKGDFDIPSNWTLGLAWHVSDNNVFLFDIQQINYSDVASVSNPISNLSPPNGMCAPNPPGGPSAGAGCLGGSNGAGFGWRDMTIYKMGYEWATSDAWTWRVGYSITDQPIPSTEMTFNIIAPGVIEQHFTFGFTRAVSNTSDFNFALMYAPSNKISGPNTFQQSSVQTVDLEMYQYELAFSYSKHF